MNLGEMAIFVSVLSGLVSIPFLVLGPFDDIVPTGKLVLNLDDSDVNSIPISFSKTFSPEKFENEYETAFGKFRFSISANNIFQELSKPGQVTIVDQGLEKTIWKIVTQEYVLEITRTADTVTEKCTTPEGQLTKTKQFGQVNETFRGVDYSLIIEICSNAEEDLQEEIDKMEQIKSQTEIPAMQGVSRPSQSSSADIVINEFVSTPSEGSEWIELYNKGDSDVNLTEWTIEDGTGSTYGSGNGNAELDGLNISSGSYLVLEKGTDFSFALNGDKDIIILKDSGAIVDQVAYGNFADGDTSDNAAAPGSGESLARIPDGEDNNNDIDDFEIDDTPTPGEQNI